MHSQRFPVSRTALALLVAAALGLSACGGSTGGAGGGGGYGATPTVKPAADVSGYGDPRAASATTTLEAHRGKLGTFLTDGAGKPVYLWEGDGTTKSACSGLCAEAWPPVTVAGKPRVGAGLQAGLAGTEKRADGSLQLTYGGHPLYRFAGDEQPGEPTGQGSEGFGASWYVLRPSGDKLDKD